MTVLSEPKPSPFNPSFWLAAATAVVTGVISSTVTTAVLNQRVEAQAHWQSQTQTWIIATDKRLNAVESDVRLANKSFEGFGKDMERLQRGVEDLKNAMMVGRPAVYAPATGRQPYP
jgi:D-alanyl-D-alanine carboxypeptidase